MTMLFSENVVERRQITAPQHHSLSVYLTEKKLGDITQRAVELHLNSTFRKASYCSFHERRRRLLAIANGKIFTLNRSRLRRSRMLSSEAVTVLSFSQKHYCANHPDYWQ